MLRSSTGHRKLFSEIAAAGIHNKTMSRTFRSKDHFVRLEKMFGSKRLIQITASENLVDFLPEIISIHDSTFLTVDLPT